MGLTGTLAVVVVGSTTSILGPGIYSRQIATVAMIDELNMSTITALQYVGPEVAEIWPQVEHLVKTGLMAGLGERNADDIRQAIIEEKSQLFLWRDEYQVHAVLVTSIVQYPQYRSVFVEAMAGRGMLQFMQEYWQTFCFWAEANGAKVLEGVTQPAVTRLLKRVGMRKVYDTVRYSLERPNVCS